MPTIEIFTQPWCPYCARAKKLLDSKGVAYTEIEALPGSAKRAELRQRAGGSTSVPQIFVDGAHIGDSDRLAALEHEGRLDALVKP
jgi:glutaredoxin 3